MTDVVAFLLSLAAAAVASCVGHPSVARCPVGWYDWDGVRDTGELTCAPTPTGPDWVPGEPDRGAQPTPRIHLRVWCVGHPVVDGDGRGARCR